MEDERAERRISARASSANRHPRSIDVTALLEIPSRIDAILDVYYSPLALQPLAVCPAIPCTSTIVHIDNGDATRRPVLNSQSQRGRCRARRTTVANDQQWRPFRNRRNKVLVLGWIKQRISFQAARCWKFNRLRSRQISRINLGVQAAF